MGEQHGAALQSLAAGGAAGVAVAVGGMFTDSLIIFRIYLLALVESSQEGFLQEICQPDLGAE